MQHCAPARGEAGPLPTAGHGWLGTLVLDVNAREVVLVDEGSQGADGIGLQGERDQSSECPEHSTVLDVGHGKEKTVLTSES